MIQRTIRVVTGLLAALAPLCTQAQQGEWRGAPTITTRVEGNQMVKVVDVSPPGTKAVQNTPYTSMAGDDDGFGFGYGWVPPTLCEVFDNAGPEDLGVFDRRPSSICNFVGTWTQPVPLPPGGAGALTVAIRILGGQGDLSQCFNNPCGCVTPTPELLINGVVQPSFFNDPSGSCATITVWTETFTGAQANALASSGALNMEVHWGNDAFAMDWSQVSVSPTTSGVIVNGNGQRGVISNPVEKKLSVKVSSPDPSLDLTGQTVFFKVTSFPPKATGYGIGGDDNASSPTYSATVDANGMATATLVLGNVEGTYTVQATPSLSISGPLVFTETAQKAASVAILKDSADIAGKAPAYAVFSNEPTNFFAVGLDSTGQKIGPVLSGWSVSGSGKTAGTATVAPTSSSRSTVLTPSTRGQVTLAASPVVKGLSTGKTPILISGVYLQVAATFDPTNPADDLPQFVPGSDLTGVSLPVPNPADGTVPIQTVTLHFISPPKAQGSVTYTLQNVTNYPGIAMNWPIDNPGTGKDIDFGSGSQTIGPVPFDPSGDTPTPLYIYDYGAYGELTATITTSKKTYTVHETIPKTEQYHLGLPDNGWYVAGVRVNVAGLTPDGDVDNQPSGQIGDGLSNFEEYRGFVAASTHIRTNPYKRDIFVVADPQLLVGAVSTTTVLTTLPFPVHYLDLSEVIGTDYPSREIVKGSPIIDPNRAGVPGARSDGQRAARLAMQSQFYPAADAQIDSSTVLTEPVWRLGIYGATILDTTDPEQIDHDTSGNPVVFHARSPDETRWSEIYEKTFTNSGIATDFSQPIYYDANALAVPPCPTSGDLIGCDEYDFAHNLVLPRIYPGGIFELHAVPYPGDWYSKRVVTCADTSNLIDYGFTAAEMQAARLITGAHEIGHSIHIDHTIICETLMFSTAAFGMIDIHPLPAYFSPDFEVPQIQLHP